MSKEHPITPPLNLVKQWSITIYQETEDDDLRDLYIATQAARWGADQELEACCEWLEGRNALILPSHLRAARRPKPPNKKQRGLTALEATNLKEDDPLLYQEILNAIEGLPND